MFSKSELSIKLQNPKVCYTNGDVISGTLTFDVVDKVDLRSIEAQFYGVATTRYLHVVKQKESSKFDYADRHILIKDIHTVFPSGDVREVVSASSFSLPEGTHNYDFSFTIPGKEWNADCHKNPNILHNKQYIRREKYQGPVNLPPTYCYNDPYSTTVEVEYFVVGLAKKSSTFKLNSRVSERITFVPHNDALMFSIYHIKSKKELYPDHEVDSTKFGFKINPQEGKGTLSKILSSNTVSVPFELRVNFKPYLRFQTSLGPSNRVVSAEVNMPLWLDIYLSTPFSYKVIQDLTNNSEEVFIASLKITIHEVLDYLGEYQLRNTEKFTILENDTLNYPLNLSTLQPTENRPESLSVKAGSKHRAQIDDKVFYRFKLPAQLYDVPIPELGQSFSICNMRKTHKLKVEVGLKSGSEKTTADLSASANIILFNSELPEADSKRALDLQASHFQHSEPVPAYEEAPTYEK